MEAAIKFSRDEINDQIPYQVIIENWDKRTTLSGKRKYYETFSAKERMTIAGYYRVFYKWALVKGVPETSTFAAKNILILKRAGNFFASI